MLRPVAVMLRPETNQPSSNHKHTVERELCACVRMSVSYTHLDVYKRQDEYKNVKSLNKDSQ